MISVVCVYNNRVILDKFLLKSLKSQSIDYELILVDNTNDKYKSGAEALNYGGNRARGDYIMFIHQDVDLCSPHWLENLEDFAKAVEYWGVLGVAGKAKKYQSVISNIYQGIPPKRASPTRFEKPFAAQTVDECLFIIPRSLFEQIKFDEQVCHDWHLYAVDYCLTIKEHGYKVFILPSCVYHHSPGYSFSNEYDMTLKKILMKHKKSYRFITTTLGEWFTFYPLDYQIEYPNIKNKLIHGLRKINKL